MMKWIRSQPSRKKSTPPTITKAKMMMPMRHLYFPLDFFWSVEASSKF